MWVCFTCALGCGQGRGMFGVMILGSGGGGSSQAKPKNEGGSACGGAYLATDT